MNFPTLGGLYNDELQAFKSLHPFHVTPPSLGYTATTTGSESLPRRIATLHSSSKVCTSKFGPRGPTASITRNKPASRWCLVRVLLVEQRALRHAGVETTG